MDAVDSSSGAVPLPSAWSALGHRLAVIVGAGAALFALVRHVPVRVASLRGAAAWFAVVLVFRVGGRLLERRLARAEEAAPEGAPASEDQR